jgi:hypothetical protein
VNCSVYSLQVTATTEEWPERPESWNNRETGMDRKPENPGIDGINNLLSISGSGGPNIHIYKTYENSRTSFVGVAHCLLLLDISERH